MSCISTTTRTRILARIAKKEAQLDLLDDALSAAATEVEEYSLNTGEGTQRMAYRDTVDIQKSISHLEAQIDALYRRLEGKGLVNLNLRRKRGGYTSMV